MTAKKLAVTVLFGNEVKNIETNHDAVKARQIYFEKVSKEQYKKDCPQTIWEEWEDIKLPERATQYSAGYDFFMPCDLTLHRDEIVKIPTGIRVMLRPFTFLMLVPRSGLGAKKRLRLNNTVGIVDYDYYFAENEGHIMAFIANEGYGTIELKKGQAFMQGIITAFTVTDNDNASGIRTGGFGSTDK